MNTSIENNDLEQKLIQSSIQDSNTSVGKKVKKVEILKKLTTEEEEKILKEIGGPIKTSYNNSNCCSKLFFCWTTKLITITRRLALKSEYLGKIDEEYSAETYSTNGINYWKKNKNKYSLLRSIFNLNAWKLSLFFFICILVTGFSLVNVLVIQNIIRTYDPEQKDKVLFNLDIYWLCGIYLGLKLLYIIIFRQGVMIEYILCYKAGIELISIIYDKILTVTQSGKEKLDSEGEIVNYIQIDSYKIINTITQSPTLITNPLQVIVYTALLFEFFGWTYVFGLVTLIIFFTLNYFIFQGYRVNEEGYLASKDSRMKITNQVFNHLKILKFNSWINEFKQKINEKRDTELEFGQKILNLSIWNIFLFWTSPIVTTVITIGAYFYFTGNLQPDKIFTAMTIFAGIQDPLRNIPSSINSVIDLVISMNRIEKFLNQPDRDPNNIKDFNFISKDPSLNDKEINDKLSIRLKNCSYSWGNKSPENEFKPDQPQIRTLKNINLEVKKGEFVGVIGEVGSGKSSFLHLLLNNLMKLNKGDEFYDNKSEISKKSKKSNKKKIKIEGEENTNQVKVDTETEITTEKKLEKEKVIKKIEVNDEEEENLIQLRGSISYVSQTAWIQNATVRDNILLFKEYVKEKYDEIIKFSELKPDLKILAGGDLTEIGEKGINLSGGQKTRVSLARATYSDSDIFLFDDPLAALDGNVGNSIFHNLLKNYLHEKTRILVTNNINYLEFLDKIILLKKGEISFIGTYKEFQNSEVFLAYSEILNKSKKEEEKPKDITSEKEIDNKQEDNNKANQLIQDEDKEVGNVKFDVYLDYMRYNGGVCVFILIVLIMLFWQVFKIGGDYWMSLWVAKTHLLSNAYYNYAVYAGLSIISNIFIFFRLKLLVIGTIKMAKSLHSEMLDSLTSAPINLYHDIEPKGRILNRLSKDLEYVTYIMFSIGTLLANMFILIGTITLTSVYVYYLIAFLPILFLIGGYCSYLFMYPSRELTRIEGVTRSKILNVVSETLPGVSVICTDNKQENYRSYLNKVLSDLNLIEIYLAGIGSWFGICLDILSFLFIASLMSWIMIFPYWFNQYTIGFILSYSNSLSDSLYSMLSNASYLENTMVSLERCVSYTKIISEKQILTDAEKRKLNNEYLENSKLNDQTIALNDNIQESEKLSNTTVHDITDLTNSKEEIVLVRENWPEFGNIEFINFSVQYRPNTPTVLNNICISIKDGEKIGVVGRTGSGKSTLCLCLFRILEALYGKIKIDGEDISKIPLDILRKKLTIIPQDSAILDGTLRFNIDPINLKKDNEIIDVLQNIGLWSILKEKNINCEITEDSLSVGERQLVCIARAIVRNSKIIVTDEATASIDHVTEEKIQKAFSEYFSKSTIITIAHRIKTVVNSDKILVLDKGNVVEFDTPTNLLNNKNGFFYALYNKSV